MAQQRTPMIADQAHALAFFAHGQRAQWESLGYSPAEVNSAVQEAIKAVRTTNLATSCSTTQQNLYSAFMHDVQSHTGFSVDALTQYLRQGRSVAVGLKLPEGGDHWFNVKPLGDGRVQIEQAWQNKHMLAAQPSRSIAELTDDIRRLQSADTYMTAKARLFGFDKIKDQRVSRGATFYEGFQSGQQPSFGGRRSLMALSVNSDGSYHTVRSRPSNRLGPVTAEADGLASHRLGASNRLGPVTEPQLPSAGRAGAAGGAVGGTVSFILIGAGVVGRTSGLLEKPAGYTVGKDLEQLLVHTAAGTASGATAGGLSIAWASRVGPSMWRAGGVAALVGLTISSLYDEVKKQRGDITSVEQRKNFSANVGGAVGGLGAAVGSVALLSNPVGWAALGVGLVAGVAGGVAGSYAGSGIDLLIFDEGEDHVMRVYEFFRLQATRNKMPRPIHQPELLSQKFKERLQEVPNDEKWAKVCLVEFHFLLISMFPTYAAVMKITQELKKATDELTPTQQVELEKLVRARMEPSAGPPPAAPEKGGCTIC